MLLIRTFFCNVILPPLRMLADRQLYRSQTLSLNVKYLHREKVLSTKMSNNEVLAKTPKSPKTQKKKPLTDEQKIAMYAQQKEYRQKKKQEIEKLNKRIQVLETELSATRLALRIVRNIPFGSLPSDVNHLEHREALAKSYNEVLASNRQKGLGSAPVQVLGFLS